MMKDPHVKALFYQLLPGKNVDYKNAPPIHEESYDFIIKVENDIVIFEMKTHFSNKEDAKALVDAYLKRWEILIGLEHDLGDLRFEYRNAEVIDRAPKDENSVTLNAEPISTKVSMDAVLHVSRGRFPSLPKEFVISPDVETLYLQYQAYREGRESLLSMAYMCLTVLEASAGGRSKAASKYSISNTVLNTLGKTCSEKGNANEARKAPKKGSFLPLSSSEKHWVTKVIKAIIRRAGEWAHDPSASLPQITMADFPSL